MYFKKQKVIKILSNFKMTWNRSLKPEIIEIHKSKKCRSTDYECPLFKVHEPNMSESSREK